MRLAIGCDNAAVGLKEEIKQYLDELGVAYTDYGVSSSASDEYYADIAANVALAVKHKQHERGIVLCGTGIGVCIMANKIPGIRAALCHDTFSAERARKSNNAQILTMGARVIGSELAKKIVATWLAAEFVDGPSTPKINRIMQLEKENAEQVAELEL